MSDKKRKTIISIKSLKDIMMLNDEMFVKAAYYALLGRYPDNDGLEHYLRLIREGVQKEDILAELYYSDEGRSVNCDLPGLEQVIGKYRLQNLPVIGGMFKSRSNEKKKKRAIENQLHMLSEAKTVASMEFRMGVKSRNQAELKNSLEGFDRDWYLRYYDDVREQGLDPLEHYRAHGQSDGRFRNEAEMLMAAGHSARAGGSIPDRNFDAGWYLEYYEDVKQAGMDPWEHYIRHGKTDGRFRNRTELLLGRDNAEQILTDNDYTFDALWYLEYYADVRAEGMDALEHYLRHGINDGRYRCRAEMLDKQSSLVSEANSGGHDFDAEWYLRTYEDVKAAGIDPHEHYVRHGRRDGRFRCLGEILDRLFDADTYLAMYPDVAESALSPLEHFLQIGWAEGRMSGSLPLTLFDPDFYLRRNPDVAERVVEPLRHFLLEGGCAQGRPYSSFIPLETIELEAMEYSCSPRNAKARLIVFYQSAFQAVPEHDRSRGRNLSEWHKVLRGKSFYAQHEQPRLPGELGFYDLRVSDIMRRQADLARIHGIYGFCFFLARQPGLRVGDRQLDLLLSHPEIDIHFCVCCDLENRKRGWDDTDPEVESADMPILIDEIAYISAVADAFRDPRYIRVNNKPLLLIYQPDMLPDAEATIEKWRAWCRENQVGEIQICAVATADDEDPRLLGIDAVVQFPPFSTALQEISSVVENVDPVFSGQVFNYLYTVNSAKRYQRPEWLEYRGVMPGWDNTARMMENGVSFYGSTPSLYADWLDCAISETVESLPEEHRFVFINAWNDWTEGSYLEPDMRRGYAYLNRTREVVDKYADHAVNRQQLTRRLRKLKRKHDVAVVVHLFYCDLFVDIADYLDNFAGTADLYFTVREGAYDNMQAEINQRFPDALVLSYPNQGRDVLPFLRLLPSIIDLGYRAICKVHTKKSKHLQDGHRWRSDVFNKLIGSADAIAACLQLIEQGAGLVAPAGHLLAGNQHWGTNQARVVELAAKMDCPTEWLDDFKFVAGTMFWFVPDALRPLLRLNLQPENFELEAGQVDGTIAHAVERLVGLSVMKSGYPMVASDGLMIQKTDSQVGE